ncbi:hypothetical protein [Bacillus fonticola]|nr:hypothetical protein [Bacillus fonticola]
MGKKPRNSLRQKKNNHVPPEVLEAKEVAHKKEFTSAKRKNGPGDNTE